VPVYEYLCDRGHHIEAIRRMELSSLSVQCTVCGSEAKRIISPVRVFGDYQGYVSPVSGRWVEGRRARDEDMKRNGCRPYESGEREEAIRRAADYERKVEEKIDESVERAASELNLRR